MLLAPLRASFSGELRLKKKKIHIHIEKRSDLFMGKLTTVQSLPAPVLCLVVYGSLEAVGRALEMGPQDSDQILLHHLHYLVPSSNAWYRDAL